MARGDLPATVLYIVPKYIEEVIDTRKWITDVFKGDPSTAHPFFGYVKYDDPSIKYRPLQSLGALVLIEGS